MKIYAYDIECLKNLFTAIFVNAEDKDEKHTFVIGLGNEDYSPLLEFLKQEMVLVGYNNDSYDNPMLRFIMSYRGTKLLSDLYELSSKLIDDNYRNDKKIMELRYPKPGIFPWKSVDVMRIMAFDKLGISLKQTAISLKWHKIQDMPVYYTENVNLSALDEVLKYNLNDVLITLRLYEEITPLRKLRQELSEIYEIDLSSASDSRMANLILEKIYATEMRQDIRTIRNLRTPREKVLLGNCVAKFVSFKSPELQELLDRISATYVYRFNNYIYSEKITFANNSFALGIGGLHTEDAPGIFVTDDNYVIMDADVASYYPNLIINNKFYPEHLGEGFIGILKKITKERLAAKKAGDKVKADGLKITINSIFGKLGSETFWLYDPKQFLSTTISGQMGLLMLVEKFSLGGIAVISCNTDGVVCKIPRDKLDLYYKIAKQWETETNLQLEFTEYSRYVRRDVNSYITEKADGSTKEKGAFVKEIDLKKSYHMPIVAKALYAYFIKNIPVRETLESSKDIFDFCISQKSGTNFKMELHTISGVEELQKTNRFFISKRGGSMLKRDIVSNRTTGLYVGNCVRILNDFNEKKPFKEYEVDLNFYEKEVMKIVDEIEPKQIALFDLANLGNSSFTKMSHSASRIEKQDTNNVFELNKLGKNQLSKKIEDLVKNNEKIKGISPRYVFVEEVNTKQMTVDVYCLAKSVRQTLFINKKAYAKNKLVRGQLVFCSKFDRNQNGFVLVEYKITDKIEETKEGMI